jgi:hypothetical protein
MKEEKVIMYDSPEAATFKTGIEGWVDKDGRFWGKEEHMARWSGCTHQKCECGGIMKKTWTKCEKCRAQSQRERYYAMPQKEWNGEYLYSDAYDKYFFNEDDVMEFLAEEEISFEDLRAVACSPNYLSTFEFDGSEFPDDQDEASLIDKELIKMLSDLNKKIEEHKPISYSPGKIRFVWNSDMKVQVSDTTGDDSINAV